jgi:hypothetical protein
LRPWSRTIDRRACRERRIGRDAVSPRRASGASRDDAATTARRQREIQQQDRADAQKKASAPSGGTKEKKAVQARARAS